MQAAVIEGKPKPLKSSHSHYGEEQILVVDRDPEVLKKSCSQLKKAGIDNVITCRLIDDAADILKSNHFNLIFLDVSATDSTTDNLRLLSTIRARGYWEIVAVTSRFASFDLCYKAARLGANDFVIKSPHFNFAKETIRMLGRRRSCFNEEEWSPQSVIDLSFFSSVGFSRSELVTLREFASGFPRYQRIAKNLGVTHTTVRKTFSRIYEKLDAYVPVQNPAQLSHFLTICSLYK